MANGIAWRPAFDVSLDGLTFAVVAGLALWALFLLMWYGSASLLRLRNTRSTAIDKLDQRHLSGR